MAYRTEMLSGCEVELLVNKVQQELEIVIMGIQTSLNGRGEKDIKKVYIKKIELLNLWKLHKHT